MRLEMHDMSAEERLAWERLQAAELEVVQAQNELIAVTNRKARRGRLTVIPGGGSESELDYPAYDLGVPETGRSA